MKISFMSTLTIIGTHDFVPYVSISHYNIDIPLYTTPNTYILESGNIQRINILQNSLNTKWMNHVPEFGTLKFIGHLHQTKVHSGCSQNNGGCVEFCLPTGEDTFNCSCPDEVIETEMGCRGVISCPLKLNGVKKFKPFCRNIPGQTCFAECDNKEVQSWICSYSGEWIAATNCDVTFCPLELNDGRSFQQFCQNMSGQTCFAKCQNTKEVQSWICSHSGEWIATTKCEVNEASKILTTLQSYKNTLLGIGSALGFFIILVVILLIFICKRKCGKQTNAGNEYSNAIEFAVKPQGVPDLNLDQLQQPQEKTHSYEKLNVKRDANVNLEVKMDNDCEYGFAEIY